MRDPAAVAADITHDADGNKVRAGGGTKHARHHKKAAAQEAAQ